MKEGMTITITGPIYNNGGTINGDIVNPTYHLGPMSKAEKRKLALQHVEQCIGRQVQEDPTNRRRLFLPLVAAIRVELMGNTMSHTDFNVKYGTNVSQSTYSEYVPRDISGSKISENDSSAFESELRAMLET